MKTHRNILIAVSLFFALAASPPAFAASTCTPELEREILALFKQWNDSLTKDPADPAAVDANTPRCDPGPYSFQPDKDTPMAQGYFKDEFLSSKEAKRKIDKSYVRCFGDIAINSGRYTSPLARSQRRRLATTFVYQKQSSGRWLIIEHHSSKMPK